MPSCSVYVISDLHLGGDPDEPDIPGSRGFQICRQGKLAARFVRSLAGRRPGSLELVVNGDIVDFLAEHPRGGGWQPFHRDAAEASWILRVIAERREPELFGALREMVVAGHRLTLILGNHDIELSLPAVRRELRALLGDDQGHLRFLYDNEAHVIGKLVIEHGNRADPMNEVDHDGLRRVRVLQSMHADSEERAPFTPPPGSRLVAELMNPLKVRFPFIDLLKPEAEGMVPILIALDPSVLRKLPRLLAFGAAGASRAAVNRMAPAYGGEISSYDGGDELAEVLARALGPEDASALLEIAEAYDPDGGEIASAEPPPWRIAAALRLLRRLVRADRSFDMAVETCGRYRDAACEHVANGFQAVVFGHTHHACREAVDGAGGARGVYLNAGTWIDLIRLPEALFEEGEQGTTAMAELVRDLLAGRLERWVLRYPTYARLEVAETGDVERAALCVYREEDPDAAGNVIAE